MEDKEYIEQLKDIRSMMDRSSRFVSLSGLSGVMAGLYALAGSVAAYYILLCSNSNIITLESKAFRAILLIAILVLVLSIVTAVLFSWKKASKRNEPIWNSTSKRLIINFGIPLVTGAVFAILLIKQGHYGLLSPITLLFYGLGLINASKYTYETLRSLGISFIILGLINTAFPGYGLYFWGAGFGLLHVFYGTYMYFKFDRK